MIHPHTKLGFISESIGCGVLATEFIPKGTIIWVLDQLDLKLDQAYVDSLDELLKKRVKNYGFRNSEGKYFLCWDSAQFMNHSPDTNCFLTPYELAIAVRDIQIGEELTDDYGYLNYADPLNCSREQDASRKAVMADDVLHLYKEWDQKIMDAMQFIDHVKQPLKHLISKKTIDKINAVLEGKEQMDSIISLYYDSRATGFK